MILFQSDYLEGCHPAILQKLTETNLVQTPGYSCDSYCEEAADLIRDRFACPQAAVHFLVGGTQTNAIVIASLLRPFEGALCAETGHINVHETGAVEASGHKALTLPHYLGRITGDQVRAAVRAQGDNEHTVRPGLVYISLPTELGTLYSLAELKDLHAACKECGLPLFIDGARLGYGLSAPACDITPEELAANCDMFYIGGTKVGALFGEAVVFTNATLAKDFRYMMKQRGAMLAKGRLLGVQFGTLMKDNLYFNIGKEAVAQALRIRDAFVAAGIPLFMDSPTNQQFVILTKEQQALLSKDFGFELWEPVDESHDAIRFCTSWATTEENLQKLLQAIAALK